MFRLVALLFILTAFHSKTDISPIPSEARPQVARRPDVVG